MWGFLINIVLGLVLSFAGTLLQQAFGSKQEQEQRRTGTRGSAQIGGKVPQYFLVGTVGEAGKLEYQNAWGNDGQVPNAYLTSVTSFGDLPVSAMSGLYVNGVRVTLSATGGVAQGYPVPELANKFWWKFFDGRQVTADSYLVEKFGGDADRAWASDMVGIGVPYLITTALWDENLWTGFPSVLGEFQGIPLFDPRKDSTAGGVGAQRWADPATWTFSDNSAVIIYNIERGIYYNGAHVWGGKKTAPEMPYAVWAAAMDACDEAVALDAGGTEKRFRAGRRISLNERPADVIKELLIGSNARISHASDGQVYILVGVPAVADGAFTQADVLATEPLGSIPWPNLDEIINGATATYREPLQAWEDKETAPYLRSDLVEADDGRENIEGLDLATTFSGTQAQRVIKAVIEEGRRFDTHVVALPPEFAQFRPLQVLAWTSDRFGYSAKLFLITARTREPFGNVVLGLQEIDPADHDWNPETDEQPLSFAPVVTNRPPPQEVSGFFVEPAIWVDSLGRSRRPAIDVFWASASVAVDVDFVRIAHRLAGETTEGWVGLIPRPNLLEGAVRIVEALLPDEDYEVQIQYIAGSGRATLASGWLAVHTPDVKLGALDVVYGDLDLDELGQQAEGYFDWMGQSIQELIEQAQAQAMLTADQIDVTSFQFDEMRRNLAMVSGGLSASFEETITVAIVPMQGQLVAIADALTELSAANDGDVNTARIRFTAVSGPTGYSRVGIETRFDAQDSGDFRLAGSYWDTPNNNSLPTRRMEIAEQFVIAESAAAAAFQPFIFQSGILRVGNAMVGTAAIVDGAITRAKIGSAAIGTAEIENGAITRAKIGSAAIGSAEIENAAITSAKIGNLAVDTIQIANGAIANYVFGATFSSPSWYGDAFVANAFPATLSCSSTFMLGTSGSDPDSNVFFLLQNLTVGSNETLEQWTNASPGIRGQSTRVRLLNSGHTYRLVLQPVVSGTGSVSFTSTPVFSAIIPKK